MGGGARSPPTPPIATPGKRQCLRVYTPIRKTISPLCGGCGRDSPYPRKMCHRRAQTAQGQRHREAPRRKGSVWLFPLRCRPQGRRPQPCCPRTDEDAESWKGSGPSPLSLSRAISKRAKSSSGNLTSSFGFVSSKARQSSRSLLPDRVATTCKDSSPLALKTSFKGCRLVSCSHSSISRAHGCRSLKLFCASCCTRISRIIISSTLPANWSVKAEVPLRSAMWHSWWRSNMLTVLRAER